MRQDEPTTIELHDNTYHIFPFPAMKAANLSGELFAILGPALRGLSSLTSEDSEVDLTGLTSFFATLNGDKVEGLLRKLLTANKNISVEIDGEPAKWLNGELADKIFCGAIGDMYRLAVEVIKVNYGDFFDFLGGLFGEQNTSLPPKTKADMEN